VVPDGNRVLFNMNHYVYQYFDPIRKEPIYVGYGKGARYKRHLSLQNKHPFIQRIQWIRKQGVEPIVTLVKENLTEEQALKLEGQLERKIGRKNINKGPLLNLKPCGMKGGSPKGFKQSSETIAKRVLKLKGQKRSKEVCLKMSLSHKKLFANKEKHPMFGKHHTSKANIKNSLAHLGKKPWNKGIKNTQIITEETRSKLSESVKKSWILRRINTSITNKGF
jgi:hypothetical protein